MSKKRIRVISCSDKYKQTDISTYFKVKSRASTSTVCPMRMKQKRSIDKENDSEEMIVSPHKKPKPIPSDNEEAEEFLNNQSQSMAKRSSSVLQDYQLPFPLPTFKCCEDSDSEAVSDSQISLVKRIKKIKHTNLKLNLAAKDILVLEPILISSEEEFEATPANIKNAQPFSPNKKTASPKKRQESAIQKKIEQPNSRKILFQSEVAERTITDLPTSINPKKVFIPHVEFLTQPATSKTPTTAEKADRILIGVNRSAAVSTVKQPSRPRILNRKSYSDSNLPQTKEFISTDFVSNADIQILSTSFTSTSSNDTLIYEQDINVTVMEGDVQPKQVVTIIEDVVIPVNTTAVSLEQCGLSPIKGKTSANTNIFSSTQANSSIFDSPKKSTLLQHKPATHSIEDDDDEDSWSPIVLQLFTKIVQYIGSHSHLKTMLSNEESDLLKRFFEMPNKQYMFVCLKLYTRIHKWYNIFKLRTLLKLEMSDPEIREMYTCLTENAFVDVDYSSESCIDLLDLLLRKDIKEICDTFKIKFSEGASQRKADLIQRLLLNCNRQATLTFFKSTEDVLRDRIKNKLGICVKLSSVLYNIFDKVHLLYKFTMDEFETTNDLYFFLSKIEFKDIFMPKTRINMNVEVFLSITEFSRFAKANECRRAVEESFVRKETEVMLDLCQFAHSELEKILASPEADRPSYLRHFTAGHQYTRALSIGAKHLTRHHPNQVEEWLIFLIHQNRYCLRARGYWYDLLVMVQCHYLKHNESAVETLIEAFDQAYLTDVDRHDLNNRAELIKKIKSRKISELLSNKLSFVQPEPLKEFPCITINAHGFKNRNSDNKVKRKQYLEKTEKEESTSISNVEMVALNHYFKNGFANGIHCEGSLLESIFFVLFWDIIYESNVPGAFINELQYLPLDLKTSEFYTNRKDDIEQRLNEIRSKWPYDQLKGFIRDIWEKHAHEKSYLNDKLVDTPDQLYDIILCIGRVKLVQCLERLAKNFRTYHSGLPDLFLWNVGQKKCKFVEVKSDNDKLSTKQKIWLTFLQSIGADIEVCHVHTIGAFRSKPRKVKSEVKKEKKRLNKSQK